MHRTVKPRPHHLRDTARIVAVCLINLRLQHRPYVPRFNTDHRQLCFGESTEALKSHCDIGPASNPIRLNWYAGLFSTANSVSGSLAILTSRTILPVSSTMQTLVPL